jgi:hypothetical protein
MLKLRALLFGINDIVDETRQMEHSNGVISTAEQRITA